MDDLDDGTDEYEEKTGLVWGFKTPAKSVESSGRVLRIAGAVGFFFAGAFVGGLAFQILLTLGPIVEGGLGDTARSAWVAISSIIGGVGGVWLYWRWTDPNR